ncbi:hypothetical protein [Acinetobacter sp.]|uniref:hypothetical protein n=1 Tax=Acinetobacter sp. TaxID=472 RepID=UPI00388FBA9F
MSRKFPDFAYERIDPAYELLDDGMIRHRETWLIRPKMYSGLPIPFRVGQKVKVVDGNHQFPVGTIAVISHIDQGIVYIDGAPLCWERLDPYHEKKTSSFDELYEKFLDEGKINQHDVRGVARMFYEVARK